jgi:hypothetical protein
MGWLFVRGSAGSIWGSSSPSAESGIAPSVMLSGTPTPRPFSWRGWKKRPWISLLSGTTLRPSEASRGVASWISSLRASRASRSASPESAADSLTSAGSGPTSPESFARWDHATSSWRTSRRWFDTDSPTFSGIWRSSGSMRSGTCSARPRSEHRIGDGGSSCWPTPNTKDANSSGRHTTATGVMHPGTTLTGRKGPGGEGERQGGPTLQTVAQWATPAARDAKGPFLKHRKGGEDLSRQAQAMRTDGPACSPTASTSARRLNPDFVDWLMGFPPGWTACAALETVSSRSRPRSPSASCGDGCMGERA